MKRRRRSDGKVFFLFLAVALTLLLVGLVLQRTTGQRVAVNEAPSVDEIDPAVALPPGAEHAVMVALEPSIEPAYAYAYERDGGVGMALVEWDRREGEYARRFELTAAAMGLEAHRMPVLSVHRGGWAIDPVIALTSVQRDDAKVTALFVREGSTLRQLRMRLRDGSVRPAMLPSGHLLGTSADHVFEDVDGDSVAEIVVTGTTDEGAGTVIYSWDGSLFGFDPSLTAAFALSDTLFPEPDMTDAQVR